MDKKITKTQKNTLALLTVLVVLFIFVGYWRNAILKKTEGLILNKKNYAEEIANAKSPDEIARNISYTDRSVKYFEQLYINASNVVEFINFLEELTSSLEVELNIQSINSSAENGSASKSNNFETITVNLSARGDWNNVNNFILVLENLPHHINIKELRLNVSRTEEGTIWTANVGFVGIAK